ncbi:hypothetical protein Tco_0704074 [Tanacetum coccineum]|uniref:Uncharacterized protein n=1 Tax=Tanacetum coccineum TaxID=301880 RepID=A0ABQ4Y0M7_9ASTR
MCISARIVLLIDLLHMTSGATGLDELEFDDLYNNLKVLYFASLVLANQKISQKDISQAALKARCLTAHSAASTQMKCIVAFENCKDKTVYEENSESTLDLKPKNGITFEQVKD